MVRFRIVRMVRVGNILRWEVLKGWFGDEGCLVIC